MGKWDYACNILVLCLLSSAMFGLLGLLAIILPLIVVLCGFTLLLIDRKNYFAAVEKAKKGDSGVD